MEAGRGEEEDKHSIRDDAGACEKGREARGPWKEAGGAWGTPAGKWVR